MAQKELTPEELAQKELEKLKTCNKLSFPIDPFRILHDAGVEVVLKNFEKIDGIIINDEDNYTIVGINANNNLQRQRFTAAHEYCHFIKDLINRDSPDNIKGFLTSWPFLRQESNRLMRAHGTEYVRGRTGGCSPWDDQ